ncbi:DUF6932 family protein [Methylobacterium platani]|uniref:DUF6932 family protein n=1 Tax=Methylobacterium platani TaxID=427683 RepID=UPI000AC4CBB0|nr:hypothetical protein [Methylobacterium platani]
MGAFKYDEPPLLAPGRHFMTLSALERICVLPFAAPEMRRRLFQQLCIFVKCFDAAGIRCEMLINGSFLTSKPDPKDVDVAIILDPDVTELLTVEQELLVDAVNDDMNIFIDGVDGFVETVFPIGHSSFRADGNEMLWSEQYGRQHDGAWLKGVAVLRLGETDVGLRIRR